MALHFPQGGIHCVSAPEDRALKHKGSGGQLTLTMGATKLGLGSPMQRWSRENMEKAVMEFEVPAGTRLVLIFPEIFERDILLQDPKFHVKYTDKSGRQQVGVKTPCPWCKSK